jgi:hypothetical protein
MRQNLKFLMEVLALARRFNWVLINIKGQVAEPCRITNKNHQSIFICYPKTNY